MYLSYDYEQDEYKNIFLHSYIQTSDKIYLNQILLDRLKVV